MIPSNYIESQAEAIQRIYGILHPDTRIEYILCASNSHHADPETIKIRETVHDDLMQPTFSLHARAIDEYNSSIVYRTESGGDPDANPTLTVIGKMPLNSHGLPVNESTELSSTKKIRIFVANKFTIMFERVKYLYEMRQQRNVREIHNHHPVGRNEVYIHNDGNLRDTSKRPSILIGLHWLETGGAENLGLNSVQWALNSGFRVFLISEKSVSQRLISKLPDHPDVVFLRTDVYLPLGRTFEFLSALIRSENVRAIHTHHNTTLYENIWKLKTLFIDLTVIDSTHIIEHMNGGFPRTSGVWTNFVDFHHVISRQLVDYYLDEFGVSGKVKLGRMLDTVGPNNPLPEITLNLQSNQKSCRLIFVGRMVHQKRATLVVETARILQKWAQKNNIALHVDMVGTGPYHGLVQRMIAKAKLNGIFTLHEPNADVLLLMREADILLAPSSNEGLALVCYEAIESGAIPISTNVGGQQELVPAELLTRNSPYRCVADSVAIVKRLMTDEEFLNTCKEACLANYFELRRDPTAEQVLGKIYSDIVESSPPK